MQLISLKCVNCGGGLNLRPDLEEFACGYCGAELAVERSGGVVSLRLLEETIKRVQVGTDKTAAELAINRLEREMAAVNAEAGMVQREIDKEKDAVTTRYLTFAVMAAITPCCFGFSYFAANPGTFLIVAGVGVLLVLVFWYIARESIQAKHAGSLDPFVSEYRNLEAKVADQRRIIDG